MVGSAYLQLRGENVIEDARIGYRIEADREAGGRMRLDLWTEPGFGASHQAVGVGLVWPSEWVPDGMIVVCPDT